MPGDRRRDALPSSEMAGPREAGRPRRGSQGGWRPRRGVEGPRQAARGAGTRVSRPAPVSAGSRLPRHAAMRSTVTGGWVPKCRRPCPADAQGLPVVQVLSPGAARLGGVGQTAPRVGFGEPVPEKSRRQLETRHTASEFKCQCFPLSLTAKSEVSLVDSRVRACVCARVREQVRVCVRGWLLSEGPQETLEGGPDQVRERQGPRGMTSVPSCRAGLDA